MAEDTTSAMAVGDKVQGDKVQGDKVQGDKVQAVEVRRHGRINIG